MAQPVIDGTQSSLGYLQWQAFGFQPGATNNATAWAALGLPAGMSIDPSTGLISGAGQLPGVYRILVTATNSDGSGSAFFTIAIEAAAPTLSTDIDVTWDIVTGKVTLTSAIPPQGLTPPQQGFPLTVVKYGSDVVLSVTIVKTGSVLDLDIASISNALKWTIKEDDQDPFLVQSDVCQKLGSGASARYRVHVKLAAPALLGSLSNYASDVETQFNALCELELTYNNPFSGTFSTSTLQARSETFELTIAQQFA